MHSTEPLPEYGKHFANILHLKGRTVKFIDVEGEGGKEEILVWGICVKIE